MQKTNATLTGVLLMASRAIVATGIDVFAKLLPHKIPVAQVTAGRFIMQSSLLLSPPFWRSFIILTCKRWSYICCVQLLSWLRRAYFFTVLRAMHIADAIAVFFVKPFILTLLGAVILKETVGPRRIMACLVGFVGALFLIRPSFANTGAVALLPLETAACFAVYMILTRPMVQKCTHWPCSPTRPLPP